MAILEKIRKRSLFLILVIGLALFSFVISDVIRNGNFGGEKSGTTVAKINGTSLPIENFRQQVENMTRRFGPNASTTQVVNTVWNQELRKTLLSEQYKELGIQVTQNQMTDLITNNAIFTSDPRFQDENGNFQLAKFTEFIADLKANNPLGYEAWTQQEQALIENAKEQTYFNLVKAGINTTLKEGELAYQLENDKIAIKYAQIPYTSIPDSTITITNAEIENYLKNHKDDFQVEASRDIQYIYFEEKPSQEDDDEVKNRMTNLLQNSVRYDEITQKNDTVLGFTTTTDIEDFVNKNSDIKFDSTYVAKKDLAQTFADTLFSLQKNEIFGPYKDDDYYKISKMLNKKANGSAKARHILIAYKDAERADTIRVKRTKEEAQTRAKEMLAQANATDADFAKLARENSDGPSASQGGDLGFFQEGMMTPAFNDFVFQNPAETIGLVETEFGFHVIKIEEKQDVVQIATIAQKVVPSEKTINDLFTEATQFEMEVVDNNNFAEVTKEKEYNLRPVNNLQELDENLAGIGNQRAIVQWAFNKDTKKGDIKRFNVNGGYAIVQLTAAAKKGLASVENATLKIRPILLKQKKAAQILAENKGKTLAELTADKSIPMRTASNLNRKIPNISGAGREPKVVGAAFTLEEGQTSDLIEGERGIYKVEITKKETAKALDNYITYAKTEENTKARSVNTKVYNAIKEKADIEDNRADFY